MKKKSNQMFTYIVIYGIIDTKDKGGFMRVSTSKSKNSESFYITHSYINEDGKSTSRIFKKLGTLAELSESLNTDRVGVMKWAREQAKVETKKYNKENEDVVVSFSQMSRIPLNVERVYNSGYLFLQSIHESLRFDNITRNIKSRHKYEYDLHGILKHLVISRIINPGSKKNTYEYSKTLLEGPKYEIHDIYRALSVLATESDYIQTEVYKNSDLIRKRNTKVLYYDCTNYYFEIEAEEDQKRYGKSKENRPNPIVGMGLFMDADGIPLAFDIFPGNTNEQVTLKPLESKIIRDFGVSEFVFCSDAGLGSKSNRKYNNLGGRSYVITKSLKQVVKEIRETALDTTQYRVLGGKDFIDISLLDEKDPIVFNATYYKEIPIPIDETGINRLDEMLIVTYSPKYKKYQQKIRNKQIDRAINIIKKGEKISKAKKKQNDPKRFISTTNTTIHGEVAAVEINVLNKDQIEKEAQYDGFYSVITNTNLSIKEIIKINSNRWKIEECFRIMKTEFEARPVFLSREDRIKAHFLTCFLALLEYRLLEDKLENKYTTSEIISTLKKMNHTLVDGSGYIPSYRRTEITDLMHSKFGFRTDYNIITKSKMRSIIKQSKEKY